MTEKDNKEKFVNVRIDDELHEYLKHKKDSQGASFGFTIRRALRELIEKEEGV